VDRSFLVFVVNLVERLLIHGADINAKDELGKTALYLAIKKGQIKVIQALSKPRNARK
jgi:serine/threonine-protein phosphatase 6 regulatory ankyrin repeat subunit A